MILNGENAVIYGGAGIIGSAIARSFVREGAAVFLAGRTRAMLDRVGQSLVAGGGRADVATVDATDEQGVEHHLREVLEQTGSVAVVVNAVTYADVQGTPLLELPTATMTEALLTAVRAQMITTRAAARAKVDRRCGVVLTVVGYGPPFPGMGTAAVTWQTIEALNRQWSAELGPHGVRVAWIRIGGTFEGVTEGPDYGSSYAGDAGARDILDQIKAGTMLGRVPDAGEIGDAAAYLASDRGRSITAGALNPTAGAVAD